MAKIKLHLLSRYVIGFMSNNKPWLIIPIKQLALSKQRLAQQLSSEQRQSLAQAMLEDMLLTLKQSQQLGKIILLSRSDAIEMLAKQYQVDFWQESENCQGLNPALEFALKQAKLLGAKRALIMHGDIPLLALNDVDTLAQLKNNAIVPDYHGTGSNALLLDLSNLMPLCFGVNSFALHQQQAEKKQLTLQVCALPSLQRDIDEIEDIAYLKQTAVKQSLVGRWFAKNTFE